MDLVDWTYFFFSLTLDLILADRSVFTKANAREFEPATRSQDIAASHPVRYTPDVSGLDANCNTDAFFPIHGTQLSISIQDTRYKVDRGMDICNVRTKVR